jgi:hypothetical protein
MQDSTSVNSPLNNNSIFQSTQVITTPTETNLVPVDDTHGIHPTSTEATSQPLPALVIKQLELKKAAALDTGDNQTVEKCEAMLSILENGGDIAIMSSELRELFEFYAGNGTEAVKSGLEFLESILPPEMAELGRVQDFFEITKNIAVLGAALIEVANTGAGIAVLYYKQKLLDASGSALNAAKTEITRLRQANQLTEQEFENAKRGINEWSAALNAETELFEGEFNLFIGQAIASGVGSLAEFASAGIAGVHAGSKLIPGLEAVGASALAVHAYLEMKEKIEDDQTFSAWQAEFSAWQKQAIAQFEGRTIDLTEEELESLKNPNAKANQELDHEFRVTSISLSALSTSKTVSDAEVQAFKTTHVDDERTKSMMRTSLKSYYKSSLEEAAYLPSTKLLNKLIELKIIKSKDKLSAGDLKKFREIVQGLSVVPSNPASIKYLDTWYQTWFDQTKATNPDELIKLTIQHQGITNTGVVPAEDLLAKRKNVTQEKAAALLPKFEQKREKIYEALKSYYKESLEEALNPDADTLKILIKLKLITEGTQELSIEEEKEYKEVVQYLLKNAEALEGAYDDWFGQLETSNKEDLIKLYIDKHQTIEQTLKHSLREVVDHKLKIENEFIKLSLKEAKATFGVTTACAIISIGLFIVGLATLPLGGVGAILMLVAAAPIALSLGFWVAELVLSYRKKPATTLAHYKGLSFKLITNRLMKGLAVSRMNSKAEKVKTQAALIDSLTQVSTQNLQNDPRHQADLREASTNFQKAKADYEASQISAAKWTERVDNLEKKLGSLGWQDFAKNASLQIGKARKEADSPQNPFIGPIHPTRERLEAFDSLTAFNDALKNSDFDLLSDETLYILESQLGIRKTELQSMISEGGNSLELLLQKFSVLKQDEILRFIARQTARMKLDLIPNPVGGIVPNTANPNLITP